MAIRIVYIMHIPIVNQVLLHCSFMYLLTIFDWLLSRTLLSSSPNRSSCKIHFWKHSIQIEQLFHKSVISVPDNICIESLKVLRCMYLHRNLNISAPHFWRTDFFITLRLFHFHSVMGRVREIRYTDWYFLYIFALLSGEEKSGFSWVKCKR